MIDTTKKSCNENTFHQNGNQSFYVSQLLKLPVYTSSLNLAIFGISLCVACNKEANKQTNKKDSDKTTY